LFDNPYDAKVSKEFWKPADFQLALTGSNSIQLTWTQSDSRIDGFILEKKMDGNTEHYELSKYSLGYTDNQVNPNFENPKKVEYTLRAQAGDELSDALKVESEEMFPFRVSDVDGNTYETVGIGSQIWMAENLKTTKYRNGDKIEYRGDSAQWVLLTSAASTYYDFDANNEVFGQLYNFFAVIDNRGLCPSDWHVPTLEEWSDLSNSLGGSSISGNKLKEAGTVNWIAPNEGSTNESGFTGLPGGLIGQDGVFMDKGSLGAWWSTTYIDDNGAWYVSVKNNDPRLFQNKFYRQAGFSVRCLKD
jgi:hypothetical protein